MTSSTSRVFPSTSNLQEPSSPQLSELVLNSPTFLHILERVLGFLPAKQLFQAGQVSSLWLKTATQLLGRRSRIGWSPLGLEAEPTYPELQNVIDNLWSLPRMIISFTSRPYLALPHVDTDILDETAQPRRKRRRGRRKADQLIDAVANCLGKIPIECAQEHANPAADSTNPKTVDASNSDAVPSFSNSLTQPDEPPKESFVDIFSIGGRGCIFTSTDSNSLFEREENDSLSAGFFSIPQLNPANARVFKLEISAEDLEGQIGLRVSHWLCGLPEKEKELKAVLIFAAEEAQHFAAELSEDYKNKTRQEVVVAGGYAPELDMKRIAPSSHDRNGKSSRRNSSSETREEVPQAEKMDHVMSNVILDQLLGRDSEADPAASLLCLAFAGPGIRAASVIIPPECRKLADVENKLIKLRNTGVSPHHPPMKGETKGTNLVPSSDVQVIGFMFSCVAKGYNLYRKKNVESGIFKKIFPKVPLFGFFGDGEIGLDVLPDYNNTVKKDKKVFKPTQPFNLHAWVNGEQEEEDDSDDDEDYAPSLHFCTSTFVVISIDNK